MALTGSFGLPEQQARPEQQLRLAGVPIFVLTVITSRGNKVIGAAPTQGKAMEILGQWLELPGHWDIYARHEITQTTFVTK